MNPDRQKQYDALRAILPIDLLRIDQELMLSAQRLQEAAELSVSATDDEAAAKQTLDMTVAAAAQRLRTPPEGGKQKSESQIEKELPLEHDVQAARSAYDMARTDAALCQALMRTLQEKSQNVRKACDMTVAGYITPSSYRPRPAVRPEVRSQE